jgi:putative (di)nucleoside polyphosphate hydrolase
MICLMNCLEKYGMGNTSQSEINIKQKKAEFYDWRWTDPLELPKLIVPFKKKLYEQVIEEFKTYL